MQKIDEEARKILVLLKLRTNSLPIQFGQHLDTCSHAEVFDTKHQTIPILRAQAFLIMTFLDKKYFLRTFLPLDPYALLQQMV